MIDDRPENVAGAIAAGLSGIVFTDLARLISDLHLHGLATKMSHEE